MLPVQDVIPSRTSPLITTVLVALLIAVLTFELLLSETSVRGLILSYGLAPAHLSWWSPLTAMFLHHNLLDVSANALVLWVFGDNVEDRLGRFRFVVLFLVSGWLAGLVVARVAPDLMIPIIGASGAVGGVVGAHLALMPASRILILVPVWRGIDLVELPAALVVIFWIVATGLLTGALTDPLTGLPLGLALQASGIVIGASAGRWLARRERMRCEWWNVRADHPPDRRRTSRDTSASSASSASN